jgi:hypothetical protein
VILSKYLLLLLQLLLRAQVNNNYRSNQSYDGTEQISSTITRILLRYLQYPQLQDLMHRRRIRIVVELYQHRQLQALKEPQFLPPNELEFVELQYKEILILRIEGSG